MTYTKQPPRHRLWFPHASKTPRYRRPLLWRRGRRMQGNGPRRQRDGDSHSDSTTGGSGRGNAAEASPVGAPSSPRPCAPPPSNGRGDSQRRAHAPRARRGECAVRGAGRGGGCRGRHRRHGVRQAEGPRETSRPTATAALGQRATRVHSPTGCEVRVGRIGRAELNMPVPDRASVPPTPSPSVPPSHCVPSS